MYFSSKKSLLGFATIMFTIAPLLNPAAAVPLPAKGKDITITVEFVANEDSQKAKIELIAKIGELEIDVPVNGEEGSIIPNP